MLIEDKNYQMDGFMEENKQIIIKNPLKNTKNIKIKLLMMQKFIMKLIIKKLD